MQMDVIVAPALADQSRPDELDLLKARELALRAGSFLSNTGDSPAGILRMAREIEEFLFAAGTDSYTALRARYAAVARHLRHLQDIALQTGTRPVGTISFLAAAEQFRQFLLPDETPAAAAPEEWLDRRDRMRELLREAGEHGRTIGDLARQLHDEQRGVPRETLQRWMAADERNGLVRRGGAPGRYLAVSEVPPA